ncbi:hypothetical protein KKG22_04810 [Patescibacteria group bacterium]|nr:hypothetical protein [Patescibacteria group bacterium]MBU1721656.1 hypothetical protein [Patescibacteria group bacterium]MBU1900965.1 hypothetical protein [Patescibacteria group bacterium]
MDDNETRGIGYDDLRDFVPLGLDNRNITAVDSAPAEELPSGYSGGDWSRVPENFINTVNRNFSTSAFVLILVGYVIIAALSKTGNVNMKEYVFLIGSLVIGRIFVKKIDEYRFDFIEIINTIFQKLYNLFKLKIFLGVLFLVIFDTLFNHWEIFINMLHFCTVFVEKIINNLDLN